MVMPQAVLTRSITSGFKGSPALINSRKGTFQAERSSRIRRRQTVGGAQSVVTPRRVTVSSRALALKRGWFAMKTVASAFHGAKKQLQACFAQPGDEMLRWMSPGVRPSQYTVDRW